MKCACPCGEEFEPKRSNQVYINAEHRKKDKNRRWPVKRRKDFRATSSDGLGKRTEPEISGVTPLLDTEMAQTKQERRQAKRRKKSSGEFLTSFQVAEMLGLSGWALLVWRRQHKGPEFVRLGPNTIRYPVAAFNAWLASLPRS